MTETGPHTKKKTWLSFFIRLCIGFAVFFAVIFLVLANMGGTSSTLKSAVEGFVSSSTGYHARIETLNGMHFFPTVRFDFEGLELFESAEETDQEPVITVESVKTALGFFDVMFRTGNMRVFEIRNVSSLPGSLLKRPVKIEILGIELPEEGSPQMHLRGAIGDTPFEAVMAMVKNGEDFIFTDERKITATLGKSEISAMMNPRLGFDFGLTDLVLSYHGAPVLNGELYGVWKLDHALGFEGAARLMPGNSQLDFDVEYKKSGEVDVVSGDVEAARLEPKDIEPGSPLRRWVDNIGDIFGGPDPVGESEFRALDNLDVDLDIDVKNLSVDGATLGTLSIPLRIENAQLHIQDGSGKISGGDLKYGLDLDAAQSPAKFKTDITVKDMNFGALQKDFMAGEEVSGDADILLDLAGSGQSWQEVELSLAGKIRFVSGEGQMRSGAVNIWGGGLVNSIFPSLDPDNELKVNCSIMDFVVEDGVAKANALFVDMHNITLNGSGTYNIAEDVLNIKLKPSPKHVAIGDISSGVLIKGKLASPSIEPSLFDLGTKIGKFVLGTINPAFFVLSLADLGLNDNHPCKTFLEKQE